MKTRHSLQQNENNQPASDHVLPVWNDYKQTRGSIEIRGQRARPLSGGQLNWSAGGITGAARQHTKKAAAGRKRLICRRSKTRGSCSAACCHNVGTFQNRTPDGLKLGGSGGTVSPSVMPVWWRKEKREGAVGKRRSRRGSVS